MDNIYDIIIVGGGPAGLTAAIYAKNSSLNVLILEKNAPGGRLLSISKIKNYPGFIGSPIELALNMFSQVNELSIPLIIEEVIEVVKENDLFKVVTNLNAYYSKNVIVASGTTYEHIKVKNESLYYGKGISYCVVCDGHLYKNKEVVVYGITSIAVEKANYLANIAKNTTLVMNGLFDITGLDEKVKVYKDYKISSIGGNELLNEVSISNNNNKDDVITFKCDCIFPILKDGPSSSFLRNFDVFAPNGYINVDSNCQTKVKGLYAIGDVTNFNVRQVVNACAGGVIAALNINKNKK